MDRPDSALTTFPCWFSCIASRRRFACRPAPDLWAWRGRQWLIRAISVSTYRQHMRSRSPKWATVALPAAAFRALVRPFQEFAFAGAPARQPA